MSILSFRRTIGLLCVFWALAVIALPAQNQQASTDSVRFTSLWSFDSASGGSYPYAKLVQATNGNFYGTTYEGGAYGSGTVFKVTPAGMLTTLYSFCAQTNCTDGSLPYAGLVQATNGNFYGTTEFGGANEVRACADGALFGCGTVFKITPTGTLTTLYSFCAQTNCTDGQYPYAGLVQATNGDFYGTTYGGGAYGDGTVFKITPAGTLTTLYSFCAQTNCTDGQYPYAGLVQATNGDFYGTTYGGGAYDDGTVFKITPTGTLTTLHTFDFSEESDGGASPTAGLVQVTNGDFYGTTSVGGAYGDGTVFKITPTATLTTLYSFCAQTNCTDGSLPDAGLVQASDGNLYGTTEYGGAYGPYGTVFKITPTGTLATLYSFDYTGGELPYAGGLVQATNGTFYGTTAGGGAFSDGTIFSLSVGLGPFVQTNPSSGAVGTKVTILGNNLKGSTSVTFNGTPATFTVNSTGTAITTTVPSGASTGYVQVTTPGGALTSSVKFRVLQ